MLQEQVLEMLEEKRGELVTGGEIARRLGVSRTAVWKVVGALREGGHDIESVPNSGYRLLGGSDGLSEYAVRRHLQTEALGQRLEVLPTVDSTNLYLKGMDLSSLPEGYAVVADRQTGGRGRMGRTFHSPAGAGMYLSVLLKPQIALTETPFLTICAAVAVCETLRDVYGADAGIKWVNDVYCGGRKICGILTEAQISAEMQAVEYAVVGIGINTGAVAPEVSEIATSLSAVTGGPVLRGRLTAEVLSRLERVYFDFTRAGKKQEILARYTEMLFMLDQPVEVQQGGRVFDAVARGVDENGALLVETADGRTQALNAGEVRIKPLR